MAGEISNGPSPKLVAAAERAKGSVAPVKHTPTPWEKRGFGAYVPGTPKRIADAVLAWKTNEECEANAALIVRAVNEREGLIEALKAITDRYVDLLLSLEPARREIECGDPLDLPDAVHRDRYLTMARAALSKAGQT